MSIRYGRLALMLSALLAMPVTRADPAPFDLVGPILEGTVTRDKATLPITRVPNLAGGDQLLLKAKLPADQSVRYLMVAAFLRGPTNPPPDNWFFRCKTWTRSCIVNGLALTVPRDAEQLLVFFAPETGGDFKTLRSAVQGRPGAFVRAAQELNQAALDRSRLDLYIAGVRELGDANPATLKETAPVLARSLAIKVDEKCLDRIPALQAACLTQGHESLILNDGHETSMVVALTSGPASDLAMQAGSTAKLESGAYLPYIGSIFDIARLMDSFHTAHYQYIPALTSVRNEQMVLQLNTPPSFHDPKSVLVAALPAIGASQQPTLQLPDAKVLYCAHKKPLVLLVEGAPLLFSTHYARELSLSVTTSGGKQLMLPLSADAIHGGFVVDNSNLLSAEIDERTPASVSGFWGFDKFVGPSFHLVDPRSQHWIPDVTDQAALVVGRENVIHLQAASASCIENVRLRNADGHESAIEWKVVKPNAIELKLPLQHISPGPLTLIVDQYGSDEAQLITLNAFAEAAHLDSFTLHAGDVTGTLKGGRLDQVESLQLKGHEFTLGTLSFTNGSDELPMTTSDTEAAANWKEGESTKAKVRLKDGRTFTLDVSITKPRPRGKLIAKSMQLSSSGSDHAIQLSDADEVPLDAKLVFSVGTSSPASFVRDEQIQVAALDQSFSTILNVDNGGMTLESTSVAVAAIAPNKVFGASAFGPMQFRLISRGVAGDWQRLATLVRLPVLKDLQCPNSEASECLLSGINLFLIDSVANDAQFSALVRVPDGFTGFSLSVPRPTDGRLYIKLRDDPAVINVAAFTPPPTAEPENDAATLSGAATPDASPTLTTEPANVTQHNDSTQDTKQ